MIWGEHAEKYPELLKEEAKCLLFTLGNHTYHHKDLTKSSIKEGKNEIAKNDLTRVYFHCLANLVVLI